MKKTLAKTWRLLNLPKGLQLFVMRFANDSFLVGVTGVILNDKNEVLLFKHTYRQTPWSLPGGYLKGGEHPHEGVAREIFEETGFKVKVHKTIKTTPDPETSRLDISCYGTFVGGKFKPSAEVTEHKFFAFQDLPEIGPHQTKLIKRILTQEKKLTKNNSFVSKFRGMFGRS